MKRWFFQLFSVVSADKKQAVTVYMHRNNPWSCIDVSREGGNFHMQLGCVCVCVYLYIYIISLECECRLCLGCMPSFWHQLVLKCLQLGSKC